MPSRLNQLVLKELKAELAAADTFFFVDFTGLSGRKAADLRYQLKSLCGPGASFSIVRNAIARRAFAQLDSIAGSAPSDAALAGPTAVAYGADDPVVLARLLTEWGKKNNLLRFKGGFLAGKPLGADGVAALAKIPPRPVLIGQVVGTAAAPLIALLSVSQGIIRKLIGVVDAVAKKQQPQPASSS